MKDITENYNIVMEGLKELNSRTLMVIQMMISEELLNRNDVRTTENNRNDPKS